MSEEKLTYMQQLDVWINQAVFDPLLATSSEEISEVRLDKVAKAIREKILESYKNGRKAGAGQVRGEYRRPGGREEPSHAQAKTR